MRALGWIVLAVRPPVVAFAFPVADAQRRLWSQVALAVARTGIRSVGIDCEVSPWSVAVVAELVAAVGVILFGAHRPSRLSGL